MKGRVRLIRPEFFSDSRISDLSKTTRLFYIGLWTLCDDSGMFELEVREIGATLFPYEPVAEREPWIDSCIRELEGAGRVRLLACGRHGVVPTLTEHRQKGGRPTFSNRDAHERTCVDVHARPVRTESDPDTESDTGRASALAAAAEATGGFVATVAARNGQRESRPDRQAGSRKEGATGPEPGSPSQASTEKEGVESGRS